MDPAIKKPRKKFKIQYSQLTYLEFCMMPNLFDQYVTKPLIQIDQFLQKQQYQKIGSIFILYSQTIFDQMPIPLIETKTTNDLKHLQSSVVCTQLIKLLKKIIKNFPISHEQLLFDVKVHNSLYTKIINDMVQQLKAEQQIISQGAQQKKYYRIYLTSLKYYFQMLQIHDSIKKNKRLSNSNQKFERILQIRQFYDKNLSNLGQKRPIYARYCLKFHKLNEKLRYILEPQSQQRSMKEQQSGERMIWPQNKLLQFGKSLENTYVNHLYFRSINAVQKYLIIRYIFDTSIKDGQIYANPAKIQQIELMCLLFLQQFKDHRIDSKLQIYMMLMAVKIYKQASVNSLIQQLKLIFSFQRMPAIECSYILLYTLMDSPIEQSQTTQIKQLIEFVLKSYAKAYSNDRQYVRLAVLSSLYLHFKSSSLGIKSSSRKQLIEKLIQFQDILHYINSKYVIYYVIQLILVGKQLKLIDAINNNRNHFESLLSYQAAEAIFFEHFVKINLLQQSNSNSAQQSEQLNKQKLTNILKTILGKLAHSSNPKQTWDYFQIKLLLLIMDTKFCTNFNSWTLKKSISILVQIFDINCYIAIPSKIVKLLFYILIFSLDPSFKKQALIACMLYDEDPASRARATNFISENKSDFVRMNQSLFECINGFDIGEAIYEINRQFYMQMLNKWVANSENYVYNWPEPRKQKISNTKKQRFLRYLKDKIEANDI